MSADDLVYMTWKAVRMLSLVGLVVERLHIADETYIYIHTVEPRLSESLLSERYFEF